MPKRIPLLKWRLKLIKLYIKFDERRFGRYESDGINFFAYQSRLPFERNGAFFAKIESEEWMCRASEVHFRPTMLEE